MNISPIKTPVSGEQIVGAQPEIKTFPEKSWRRRLNYYTGRTLSHTALRTEQEGRSGRLATLGQIVSPGILRGLEVDKRPIRIGGEDASVLQLSPGLGLAASGEVVTINRSFQVDVKNMRVYAPAAMLDGGGDEDTLSARRLGASLGSLMSTGVKLPPAAILVLQPIQAEVEIKPDDADPCELDPENYAYENWQLVDGARLILYSWPEEHLPLPVSGPRWRNRMAYEIFSFERHLPEGVLPPWMTVGIPIALVGFEDNWEVKFLDRHAVVRTGGKRKRSKSMVSATGGPFLWQAQFEQFNAHLAELVTDRDELGDVITSAEAAFRYLPPIGVLPKVFIPFREEKYHFFPVSYTVEMVALPQEQLDLLVQDSVALESFDINQPDRVQVVVPVPGIYYEPDLLKIEMIDRAFEDTIERFRKERTNWLGRRLDVRRKASAIFKTITAKAVIYETPDPDTLEPFALPEPFESALIEVGDEWRFIKGLVAPPAGWERSASDAFDGATSFEGSSGMGYGMEGHTTELDDMKGGYTALFCRKAFNLVSPDPDDLERYKLVVITNGGFAAYINGHLVAENNLSDKSFDALSDRALEPLPVEINLGRLPVELLAGENVLAIQVHDARRDNPFFSFFPRLIKRQFESDVGEDSYGTQLVLNKTTGRAILDDAGEPQYAISPLEELKTYLGTQTPAPLSQAEVDQLEQRGLHAFIGFLEEKVKKANDKVNLGFLRVRTDIYRIRQHILGNEAATRLVTSPALASIAKGETARATKEDLSRYLKSIQLHPEKKNPIIAGGAESINPLLFSGLFDFEDSPLGSRSTGSLPAGLGLPKTLTQEGSFEPVLAGPKTDTKGDIEEQLPKHAGFPVFHNVTVGERLEEPISEITFASGLSTKVETLQGVMETGLNISDLVVPGFKDSDNNESTKPFSEINAAVLKEISERKHDPHLRDDEASAFNASVRATENAVSVLRLVEGRTQDYQSIISRCRLTRDQLQKLVKKVDRRLKIIEDELAEARHDVSVSQALEMEEIERIRLINERRKKILKEQVPFLVFRRPRLVDARRGMPVHTLHPDLSDLPLPACKVDEDETPEEITAMMDLLREAPLKWFTISKNILPRLNRVNDLRILLKGGKLRAKSKTTRHPLLNLPFDTLSLLQRSIGQTLFAMQKSVLLQRQRTREINLASFHRLGWRETALRLKEVISLGDVIDGNHGRTGANRIATEELEQIARRASCLYLHFGEVLPAIRLNWAERLSQFDTPFNLRNLFSLPRWGEVDYVTRNEMQLLVDWLYQRIEVVHADAVGLMSDLIRICILLASHAPVSKITSGKLSEPARVRVGSQVNIVADLSRIRIGMNIALFSGQKTVARATVSDLVGGQLVAQIVSTTTANLSLGLNTRVQIAEPRSLGGVAYRRSNFLF